VGCVIVQDQMQVKVLRDRGVDEFQEAQKLLVAVAAVGLGGSPSRVPIASHKAAEARGFDPATDVTVLIG
jgi:hypothetical protein